MTKFTQNLCAAVVTLSLALSACKPKGTPTPTPVDPKAVFTAAAETAAAQMTAIAQITPTLAPTNTPVPPTQTVAASATLAPSATKGATSSVPPVVGNLADKAEFVADVTIPDGSNFAAGEKFRKTWRLKNSGTNTWTKSYSLVYSSGNQMGGPATIALTSDVAPGSTVDISVDLIAPTTIGQYVGYWMLRNPSGKNFGVGLNADAAVYLVINVTTATTVTSAPGTATATGAAGTPSATVAAGTPTATTSSAVVSSVAVSINNPIFVGKCPYTLVIPVSFTLNKDSPITFNLEAGSDTAGFQFNLPAPSTANLKAGSQNGEFRLEFSSSVSGWLQLHVTAPDNVLSNKATFNLTCSP